jgi:hypothetical protein
MPPINSYWCRHCGVRFMGRWLWESHEANCPQRPAQTSPESSEEMDAHTLRLVAYGIAEALS